MDNHSGTRNSRLYVEGNVNPDRGSTIDICYMTPPFVRGRMKSPNAAAAFHTSASLDGQYVPDMPVCSWLDMSACYQTCQQDILKIDELNSLKIGTSGPRGRDEYS